MITIGYLPVLHSACFGSVEVSSGVYTFILYETTDYNVRTCHLTSKLLKS